ncbi:MAG: WD40 repeat domain-containing protein [Armatimonadota bacterium]
MRIDRSVFKRSAMRFLILSLCLVPVLLLTASSLLAADNSISVVWKQPCSQPVSFNMTSGGGYIGTVDKNGMVRFYNRNGHLIWKQVVEGATNVLIARNGQSLLVYSRLNPLNQRVSVFKSDGRCIWKHKVEGSVWAGAVSPDGTYAAVTTGQGYAYIYRPDPKNPRYRRWKLEGIGHSIDFSPDGKRVITGTWQDSMLASYDINGKFLWRSRHHTDRQYDVQVSADGRTVLGMLPGTHHDGSIEIGLWDSGGKNIWKQQLKGFDATALVSPQSKYVAISYEKYLSPGRSDITERKVAVYKANGRLAWEKGGLFFGPRLMALSPKGSSVIVTDGEKSLYRIDGRGKILSRMMLKGTIRKFLPSGDGSKVLIYCGDGWLYLFDVG